MTAFAARLVPGFFLGEDARKLLWWILVWVFLPNLAFAAMWFVGAPPRALVIIVTGMVGLIVKRMNFWVQWPVWIALMIYSVLYFVSGLFNLSVASLLYSLQFFAEMEPGNSIEYIAAAALVLVILAMSFFVMRRDTHFVKPLNILLAGLFIGAVVQADTAMGEDMRGRYFRSAPADAPFASATQKTGLAARADGKRNLMLIVVEALGEPGANPAIREQLFAQYKTDAVRIRFDITQGTSPFYNSTTGGEIRELCGRWGDYYDLVDAKDDSCLPASLAKKGYATEAVHSFTGAFFAREKWYPNIGFQKTIFWDDLQKQGIEWCGGVFAGACDRQMPKLLTAKLKASDKPMFLYWLTLNSHLPVPEGLNLNVENCSRISPALAENFPMICRQFAIYNAIDKALIAEITAPDFPPTDILIVGDHMPPYFDKHNRSQWDAEHVPYLYLKYRPENQDAAGTP